MAGPAAPTAAPSGGVQGPGPRPAARLAVDVASGSIAASATAALRVLRFVIVAPFLWFNAMPPSVIPLRPVSTARPKPPDAGRVSSNFGPASRQTSEIPVTSSGWLITSACDEWDGRRHHALRIHHRLQIGSAWSSAASCRPSGSSPKQNGDRRLIRGDARWEAAISERIDRPSTLRRLLLYLFKVGGAAAPIGPLVVVNYH